MLKAMLGAAVWGDSIELLNSLTIHNAYETEINRCPHREPVFLEALKSLLNRLEKPNVPMRTFGVELFIGDERWCL
jgi:hypothetical protein